MVTLTLALDTRYVREDNLYNVSLRVCHLRKQRYTHLGILLSKENFKKLSNKRVPDELQETKKSLKEWQKAGEDIIKSLHPFSFDGFKAEVKKRLGGLNETISSGDDESENRNVRDKVTPEIIIEKDHIIISAVSAPEPPEENYPPMTVVVTGAGETVLLNADPEYRGGVYKLYEIMIAGLEEQGRVGTADSHTCSINSLLRFHPRLEFPDITPNFLEAYENWMLSHERSITTVGIYLRALRDVFNEAIERKLVSADCYPFGRRRYLIPTGANIKSAFSDAEVETLYNYEAVNCYEALAVDYWLFMYFANGLNMNDIALLKFGDIHGDYIIVDKREKVRRTSRSNILPITIYINERMREIMVRRGNRNKDPRNYIFPILQPSACKTPETACATVSETCKYFYGTCRSEAGI